MSWEQLIEDAKARKEHASKTQQPEPPTPIHLLSAQELHAAHLAPTLIKAEKELQVKLENVQTGNKEMITKIETQRVEMQKLVEQLERMVEDVEGAAKAVEDDPMREQLRTGVESLGEADGEDVKMGG